MSNPVPFTRSTFRNGWTTFNVRDDHADEVAQRLSAPAQDQFTRAQYHGVYKLGFLRALTMLNYDHERAYVDEPDFLKDMAQDLGGQTESQEPDDAEVEALLQQHGITVWGPRAEDFMAGYNAALAASRTVLVEPRTQDKVGGKTKRLSRLTKDETRALWYAIQWMEHVLHGWRRDGFAGDDDQAHYNTERERMRQAKWALRKVNKLREQGL